MSEQIGFNFDEPEQPKKVMKALSELPKESAEEIQKAKEKAKEKAILRDAEAKADQAKQATKERNKAAKAGQGSLDLSGADEAKAKLKAMAQEARDINKDERTYKRFGEPKGGGGGGSGGIKSMKYEPKTFKSGGKVNASSRADGCAMRGKTRGRMV
jgi:membrane protein involved in colicin uptake